jgi:lipopolysaccharide/colanic/teichoic acid biosynthesis glycosyltransferase
MDEEQLLAGGEADRVYRETVLAQKIASDLEYVRSRTLLGDLRLLLASLIRLVRLRR